MLPVSIVIEADELKDVFSRYTQEKTKKFKNFKFLGYTERFQGNIIDYNKFFTVFTF